MQFKKLSLAGLAISALLLAACQSPQNNNLSFTPNHPQGYFNVANQQIVVSVATRDSRPQPEVSSYVVDGQIRKLNALPTVNQLFQQVMQQDLNSKGFHLGGANANAHVLVNIKDFYAQVAQGNLRYDIKSKVQVEIQVQARTGQFVKRISAGRNQQGAFNANNEEIKTILSETFNEVVQSIYQDREIAEAINRYSH